MYIYRELFESRYLAGVVAHELGHFNSMDGRLLLGIRALTIPGGFFIAYLLLGALRWVAYGVSTLLVALLVVLFAFLRLNLSGLAGPLFGISIQILRMLIIFAVGGVGPALLGSFWRTYLLEREFAADAYAGRLGYANDLIAFFETEVLSDVAIPWYEQPTHPTATRRMENLRGVAARFPQVRGRGAPATPARPAPAAAPQRRHQPTAAAQPVRRGPAAAARPAWLLPIGAGLLAAALLTGALMTLAPRPAPADALRPTAGPTPTLGLP
jgi:hypothetical protein